MHKFRGAIVLVLLALAACATSSDRGSALHEAQYAWSAAIRWGDFEGAWTLLDPEYRADHPLTSLELERYKQIQVSRYHDLGSRVGETTAVREVEIGIVNRNTLVQRDARYREQWRYDPETGRWWVTSGLPDFWQD